MAKTFSLMQTKSNHSPWTDDRVCSVDEIHEEVANMKFAIIMSKIYAFEKKSLKRRLASYASMSPVIHYAVVGTMSSVIREPLSVIV